MKKRLIIIAIAVVAGLFAGTGGYLYWQEKSLEHGKLVPGIQIAEVEVGNLTPAEAIALLQEKEKLLLANTVRLNYQQKYWTLPYSAMAETDLQEMVNKAANIGRGKGPFKNYFEIRAAKRGDYKFPMTIKPDSKKITERIQKIKLNIDTQPKEPKISVDNADKVTVSTPHEGVALDSAATAKLVLQAIKPRTDSTVEAVVYTLEPKYTAQKVATWQLDGYISTFTTNFNGLNKERTENVRIAAEAIDKIVIYPGEEFSFNNIVGPRSKEAGYKESLVIQNNVFTPGLGGGVCQVSSTLYNNVLKTNLQVVQRRRHSLPVGYVSPGLDATVAYGFIDLKFKNTYDFPIIIRSKMSPNKLFIGFLGDKGEVPRVAITSNVDKVLMPSGSRTIYDPNLPKGQKVIDQPKKGYKVTVYKTVFTNSGQKKTVVSKDTYPPTPQVVRIGTNTKTVSGVSYGQAN